MGRILFIALFNSNVYLVPRSPRFFGQLLFSFSGCADIDGRPTVQLKTVEHFFYSFFLGKEISRCVFEACGKLAAQKLVPVLKRNLNQGSNSCLQSVLGDQRLVRADENERI